MTDMMDHLDQETVLRYLGCVFAFKLSYSTVIKCKDGLYGYILPRLWSLCFGKEDFVSKYGEWGLVTGCTQGIGREYARELAARGMNVVLVSRNKETLGLLSREIEEKFHVKTEVVVVDFTEPRAVETVVKEVAKLKIDISVLVNNVGMLGPHFLPFLELEEKTARDIITVNCGAVTMMCHAFLPRMLEVNKGAVINICSNSSFVVMPYLSEYAASKHFMAAFTEGLRAELSHSNVVIQLVDPGQTKTAMTRDFVQISRLEAPLPDQFVRSSILSLGWAGRTCGWWFHGLQLSLLSLLPLWLKSRFFKLVGYHQYRQAADKRKNN